MSVFKQIQFLALAALVAAPAFARAKPPLMPPRLVQNEQASSASYETTQRSPRKIVRLGLSGGLVSGAPSMETPFRLNETFAGGRLFSRLWLGGRWYLLPAVGYYRQFAGLSISNQATNLLEISAGLQFALLKLGPFGLLVGVNQRLTWRFTADNTGVRGLWNYQVGPGASFNIRFSESLSLALTSELTVPLYRPHPTQWVNQVGLLVGF